MLDKFLDLPVKVRAVLFGVVALLIVVLAVFATSGSGSEEAGETDSSAATSEPDTASRDEVDASVKAAQAPQSVDGGEDMGELRLPLNAVQIRSAATVARDFTEAYMSVRFDQTAAAWQDAVFPYLSSDSTVDVYSTVPTGPAGERFFASRQITTATATINRVQMVADSYITFEVSVETTTEKPDQPTTTGASTYLIAMNDEGGWKVNQVALVSMQDSQTIEN